MKRKILVTGSEGQVARSIAEHIKGHESYELIFTSRPDFDLLDKDRIVNSVRQKSPDIIISAAAYTDVEKAESDFEKAHRVNAVAPGIIAEVCRDIGARLIHLSTDYVFSGSLRRPYKEDDATEPLNVYGATKLAGEKAVLARLPDAVIIRTSWVYGPFGKNFVRTMLRLASERREIAVIDDQYGNPTSSLDLADGIFAIIDRHADQGGAWNGGLFHLAGSGRASWYDFAEFIFRESASGGGPTADVRRIASKDYPAKAARPENSELDPSRFRKAYGYSAPHWHISSAKIVRRIIDTELSS